MSQDTPTNLLAETLAALAREDREAARNAPVGAPSVFLVTEDNHDQHVWAVFSTRELADLWVAAHERPTDYQVEEMVLDLNETELRAGWRMFGMFLHNGALTSSGVQLSDHSDEFFGPHYVACYAQDEAHAVRRMREWQQTQQPADPETF